jgi:uncharacterized protein
MKLRFTSFFLGSFALLWAGVPPKSPINPTTAPSLDLGKQKQEAERAYRLGVQTAGLAAALQDSAKSAEHYRQAATLYRQAAEKNHIPAQYSLAYLYEQGLGVPRDLPQAAAWYRRAAEQGDPQAQNNLGVLYATGSGVPQNDAEAVKWYRLAANQNDSQGQTNLAAMYQQGRAVPQDFARAFALVQQAAESGNPVAQNNLALMYANGQGVARSYIWAYAWLHVASTEVGSAAQLRDRIAQKMKPEEVASAKQLASQKLKKINGNNPGAKP